MTDLNSIFAEKLRKIQHYSTFLKKPQRIRVEKWVEKLSEFTPNESMQRIRNQYAGLLLTQVKQKNLKEPFDHLPKESPLQRIPTYILSQQRESTSGFWSKVSSRIQAQTESQQFDRNQAIEYTDEDLQAQVTLLQGQLKQKDLQIHSMEQSIKHERAAKLQEETKLKEVEMLVQMQAHEIRVLELQLHEDKERYIREITRLKELHTAEISEMERVHQERLCIFKQQAGREQWRWCESQLENDTFLEKSPSNSSFLSYLDQFACDARRLTAELGD